MLIEFDAVGTKTNTTAYGSYSAAKEALDRYLEDFEGHSGAIVRVIYNSKNIADKWTH